MSVRSSTKIRKNSYTKMVTKIFGESDADTAILVSPLLPSKFWLRGFQVLNGYGTAGSGDLLYLDLYDGPYNGGTGEGGVVGKLIWRAPSARSYQTPSNIRFDNAYIQISNGLYAEWTDDISSAYGDRSGITVFWT